MPFTAPGAGEVIAVNRGARRALQSVVIRLEGDDAESFDSWKPSELDTLDQQKVRANLIASGLWTTLRTRPFSRIPAPGATPAAIFVTAIDTNPLAIDPAFFIEQDPEAFDNGLKVLSRIAECPVYLCTAPDSGISCPHPEQFHHVEFEGPHPAGNVGTHIHFLDPVSRNKTVWHIGLQDVIAVAHLFTEGKLLPVR